MCTQMRAAVYSSLSSGDKMRLAGCMEDFEVADLVCGMTEKARTLFLEDLHLEDPTLAECVKGAVW